MPGVPVGGIVETRCRHPKSLLSWIGFGTVHRFRLSVKKWPRAKDSFKSKIITLSGPQDQKITLILYWEMQVK